MADEYRTCTGNRDSGDPGSVACQQAAVTIPMWRYDMWTREFWVDTFERAVKTFAQAAFAGIGANATGLLDVDWLTIASVSGLAALLSVLSSIASAASSVGNAGNASLISSNEYN